MSEETIRLGRERRFLVLLGIICLALIGGALYMQIVLGEAPCPLCILQRYALLLIALFAFIGAAMRTRRSITVFEVLVVICAIAGAGVAGHHVYTQFYPAVSCGIDVLQPIVDDLPLAKIFPLGFQVDGFCSTPYPPILGLSLALVTWWTIFQVHASSELEAAGQALIAADIEGAAHALGARDAADLVEEFLGRPYDTAAFTAWLER